MPSPLHCQFGIFRIYFDYGFLPHTKEGEPTKNAFLIVRWLIAYFCPFRSANMLKTEKSKNKKLKINDVCSYYCALTCVCVCTTCAPACQFGIKLWETKISTVAGLNQLETGPRVCAVRLHRLSPLFAHWQPLGNSERHRWPTPLLLMMVCRIAWCRLNSYAKF